MVFEFSLTFRAIVLILVCAWASLLSHKGISNFNDGARPVYPELLEGRMTRAEFAVVVTGMGIGWVLAGFSQWLGTGLIAGSPLGSKRPSFVIFPIPIPAFKYSDRTGRGTCRDAGEF